MDNNRLSPASEQTAVPSVKNRHWRLSVLNLNRRRSRKGQSILEYMTLIVFLMSALFVFQKYIIRAFSGSWKRGGDTFAHGEQYDPRVFGYLGGAGGTLECFYAPALSPPVWISRECFDVACPDCGYLATDAACVACMINCIDPLCQD